MAQDKPDYLVSTVSHSFFITEMSSFFQKIHRSILYKIVYEALLSNAVLKNPERKNVRHKLGALSKQVFCVIIISTCFGLPND